MARMFNPPHPGEVLRDGVFGEAADETQMTVTDFAQRIGMSRVALSRVLNGAAAISPDMALRLEGALGVSAESWLAMQADYDLWLARKKAPKIKRIKRASVLHSAA